LRNKPERKRGLLVGFFVIFVIIFNVFFPFAIFSKICQPKFGKNLSRIGKILNSGPALEPQE